MSLDTSNKKQNHRDCLEKKEKNLVKRYRFLVSAKIAQVIKKTKNIDNGQNAIRRLLIKYSSDSKSE
jgi:hypothetical protein